MSADKRCPGCGRTGHTCWAAPCLYLEFVKSRPLGALIDWCNDVGGTLVSRQDNKPARHAMNPAARFWMQQIDYSILLQVRGGNPNPELLLESVHPDPDTMRLQRGLGAAVRWACELQGRTP